jgi:hypothetical protein
MENEVKLVVVDCSMPASVKPSWDASWLYLLNLVKVFADNAICLFHGLSTIAWQGLGLKLLVGPGVIIHSQQICFPACYAHLDRFYPCNSF